jgi:hypothetical protein
VIKIGISFLCVLEFNKVRKVGDGDVFTRMILIAFCQVLQTERNFLKHSKGSEY